MLNLKLKLDLRTTSAAMNDTIVPAKKHAWTFHTSSGVFTNTKINPAAINLGMLLHTVMNCILSAAWKCHTGNNDWNIAMPIVRKNMFL